MKKIISILILLVVMLDGCAGTPQHDSASAAGDTPAAESGDKIKIVTTIFPEYDWVMQILGEKAEDAEVTLLLDSGVDLHSYQPTAADILKISTCDMFIYVGGESDAWVEDALEEVQNKDMKVIELMDELDDRVKPEEMTEGMQEDEHDHDDFDRHDDDEIEYDEHVWLSLKNAKIFCDEIADGLCGIDPQNAEIYEADLEAYIKQLDALDKDLQTLTANAKNKTLIFGDRFPFRYLVDDYGLDYYAAFAGCSAETEASFETIAFLSGKADELGCKTIYTIDGSDGKIAQAIIDNTADKNAQIAVLDSMQATTGKQAEQGSTYISIMQKNYDVLKSTLS